MSDDTFEWLQTVNLRVAGPWCPKTYHALSFPRDDPYVKTALEAWTTKLKKLHEERRASVMDKGTEEFSGSYLKVEEIDADRNLKESQGREMK